MLNTGHEELARTIADNLKQRGLRELRTEHTREHIPPDILAVIQELERFARESAEHVNRCNADILACREEIAALNAKLVAVLSKPTEHGLAPMAHYHDTKSGVQAA